MLKLKIRGPQGLSKSVDLNEEQDFTLGRSSECDIQIQHKGISKKHCRLRVIPGGKVEVKDLGSSNGTFVNGLKIKNKYIRNGDVLTLSDTIIVLEQSAPSLQMAPLNHDHHLEIDSASDSLGGFDSSLESESTPKDPRGKNKIFLETNVYPLLLKLGSIADLRILTPLLLFIWAAVLMLLVISPTGKKANNKIRSASIDTARLYVRQLARLNQKAIIQQNYSDLISNLDARAGQTRGVLESYILDARKARVFAPAELANNSLPNRYAARAIQSSQALTQYTADKKTAFVSYPILVSTVVDGVSQNVVDATAFVIFEPATDNFGFLAMLDQFITALLWMGILSLVLLLIFNYWYNESLQTLSDKIQKASAENAYELEDSALQWPALKRLTGSINSLLSNSGGGESSGASFGGALVAGGGANNSWAISFSETSSIACAAIDEDMRILSWNQSMENMIGIQAQLAVGNDIGEASRDIGFESSVRDLCAQAQTEAWQNQEGVTEISGLEYVIHAVYGSGVYLIQITIKEEDDS